MLAAEGYFKLIRSDQVGVGLDFFGLGLEGTPEAVSHVLNVIEHLMHTGEWVPYLPHYFLLGGVWDEAKELLEGNKDVLVCMHK